MPPWRHAVRAVGDWIWPPACALCDADIPDSESELALCPACSTALGSDSLPTCRRCSSSIGPHVPNDGCSRCEKEKYPFASAQRLGVYDSVLRDAILKIKNPGGDNLAETLGLFWGRHAPLRLLESKPQAVVAVPLHWRRRWQRGFNQSESVGLGLSLALELPLLRWVVRRYRPTPSQVNLQPAERRRNVIDAFQPLIGTNVRGLRVLLIDDVLTTGATSAAVSRVLLDSGAAQVDVAVLAHR